MAKKLDKDKLDFNIVESTEQNLTHTHYIGGLEGHNFSPDTYSGLLTTQDHSHIIAKDEIVWARATETAVIPTKRESDGGYDLYCDYPDGTDNVEIKPHETIMIPTNIHVAFPKRYVMILKERGSNGSIGLAQRAGVVDSGYRGAIFVAITNENDIPVVITRSTDKVEKFAGKIYYPMNKAISQAVMVVSPQLDSKEVTMEEFNKIPSERGDGKLGSSGK